MKKGLILILVLALVSSVFGLEHHNTQHEYLVTTRSMPDDSSGNLAMYYDTSIVFFESDAGLVKVRYRYKVDSVFADDTLIISWRSFMVRNYSDTTDTAFSAVWTADTITAATTSWKYATFQISADSVDFYHWHQLMFISIDSLVTTVADTLLDNDYIDSVEFYTEEWK